MRFPKCGEWDESANTFADQTEIYQCLNFDCSVYEFAGKVVLSTK